MSVDGMKILVTGASSGIGAHIASFLVGQGATVAAAARRVASLEALADEAGPALIPVAMDVGDPASVKDATAEAARKMDGMNGLFANAGIAWTGRSVEMPDEEWDKVIDVNVNGVFRSCKAAAPIMAEGGGGAMLVTASVLSLRPGASVVAYSTSKAAAAHMVKNLALEWARLKIRVNAIAPGYFLTEMTEGFLTSRKGEELRNSLPMKRFGEMPDLEGPVELLLGSKGAFITGALLSVDGGHNCQSV
ncbi:MAG: SDR family oxidoreductase [Pseudomonadota bacterium]